MSEINEAFDRYLEPMMKAAGWQDADAGSLLLLLGFMANFSARRAVSTARIGALVNASTSFFTVIKTLEAEIEKREADGLEEKP